VALTNGCVIFQVIKCKEGRGNCLGRLHLLRGQRRQPRAGREVCRGLGPDPRLRHSGDVLQAAHDRPGGARVGAQGHHARHLPRQWIGRRLQLYLSVI